MAKNTFDWLKSVAEVIFLCLNLNLHNFCDLGHTENDILGPQNETLRPLLKSKLPPKPRKHCQRHNGPRVLTL